MKKTAIAGAFVSLCLVGSAGTAALAAGHHQPAASHQPAKAKKLKVTLNNTKPKVGQTVTATLHNGLSKPNYVCIMSAYKKGATLSAADSDTSTVQLNIKAKHGKATCKQVFLSFKTPSGHSCPPSKADKKAGWTCGIAFADPKHRTNYAVGVFKF